MFEPDREEERKIGSSFNCDHLATQSAFQKLKKLKITDKQKLQNDEQAKHQRQTSSVTKIYSNKNKTKKSNRKHKNIKIYKIIQKSFVKSSENHS